MNTNSKLLAALALAMGLAACGSDSDSSGGTPPPGGGATPPPPAANQPPVVTIKPGSTETFELMATSVGVDVTDPDGDELSFSWTQTAGTPLDIIATVDEASFTFGAPKVIGSETLSFTVEVSDGNGNTVTEDIDLLVKEAETVVMLAGIRQNNALEAFRKHFTDSSPVHLDVPLGTIGPGSDADAFRLKLSPDRTRAAWLDDHDMDGLYELKVVEVAGHGTRSLTPDLDLAEHESAFNFKWSPDSQSIAYLKYDVTNGEQLFVVPASSKDGSDARRVSGANSGAADIRHFNWSPNSETLAFDGVNVKDGTRRLFLVAADSADGSDRRDVSGVIPAGAGAGQNGSWSLDSSQYVAPIGTVAGYALFSVAATAADGSTPTQLVDPTTVARPFGVGGDYIQHSPTGSLIAFRGIPASDATKMELFVVKADGTELRRVSGDTTVADAVRKFRWSPDGTSLAFTGDLETDDVIELFVVPAISKDGSDRSKVSGTIPDWSKPADWTPDGFIFPSGFRWSPDSKNIAFTGASVARFLKTDIFIVAASGNGSDRRTVSGAAEDFDSDGNTDSFFYDPSWSPDGKSLYFIGDISRVDELELLKVAADSTDGGDRVSVSGQMATGGGHVSEYDVGGPTN